MKKIRSSGKKSVDSKEPSSTQKQTQPIPTYFDNKIDLKILYEEVKPKEMKEENISPIYLKYQGKIICFINP